MLHLSSNISLWDGTEDPNESRLETRSGTYSLSGQDDKLPIQGQQQERLLSALQATDLPVHRLQDRPKLEGGHGKQLSALY